MNDGPDQRPDAEADTAGFFRRMADRIDATNKGEFAGAVVVVPPGGNPIELLLVDPTRNPALLWATVKSLIDQRLGEISEGGAQGMGAPPANWRSPR